MSLIFSKVGLYILGGLAIVGAVLAILAGARQAGKNAERVAQMKVTLNNVRKADEIERNSGKLSDADRNRLRNYRD